MFSAYDDHFGTIFDRLQNYDNRSRLKRNLSRPIQSTDVRTLSVMIFHLVNQIKARTPEPRKLADDNPLVFRQPVTAAGIDR